MIKVSVIVPIYNAEDYIEECLNSLKKQTLKEVEFILINDGSTDQTEKLIKPFLKEKRFQYYKRTNHGIGATRNFGISKARGEYITFLDSDDYIAHDALEKMYQKSRKEKLDVIVCDYLRVKSDKNELVHMQVEKTTSLKETPDLLLTIHLAPWGKLYKRELIENNNILFPEKIKYEDVPFVTKALLKAEKIGKIDEAFIYYRIHDNSETTVMDKRVFDIFSILEMVIKLFQNEEQKISTLNDFLVQKITTYTIQQRYQKNKKIRKEFIDQAFLFLKKNVPNYKESNYFKNRNKLKRTIEKNKLLTNLYCNWYIFAKKI